VPGDAFRYRPESGNGVRNTAHIAGARWRILRNVQVIVDVGIPHDLAEEIPASLRVLLLRFCSDGRGGQQRGSSGRLHALVVGPAEISRSSRLGPCLASIGAGLVEVLISTVRPADRHLAEGTELFGSPRFTMDLPSEAILLAGWKKLKERRTDREWKLIWKRDRNSGPQAFLECISGSETHYLIIDIVKMRFPDRQVVGQELRVLFPSVKCQGTAYRC